MVTLRLLRDIVMKVNASTTVTVLIFTKASTIYGEAHTVNTTDKNVYMFTVPSLLGKLINIKNISFEFLLTIGQRLVGANVNCNIGRERIVNATMTVLFIEQQCTVY